MTRQQVVLPAQSRQESLKQQRTHELLVELLSYQLASPVRWIETQKSFSRQSPIIERYVEVGPSKILANMAVKQIGRETHPESHLVNRQFLSSSDNAKDIFYQYDDNEPEASESEPTPANSPASETVPTATAAAPAPPPAAPVASAPAAAAAAVEDSPLTATDAVIAITAQKLRKGFDEVPTSKSIQELSGGKSTLQNEILGDLGVELGNLPDGSEDLPLATLGAALAGSFKGEPGKQISSLIAKLVSSKMPPSFNRQAIQRYLGSRWGLGPQRQNAVITFSITLEPASRLASADAAQAFFDSVAQRYASFAGVTLSAASGGASSSQATVVDSEALQAVKKDHQKSLLKIHEVISNLVKEMGEGEDDNATVSADNSLLEKLDHWVSEFGDDMYLGTKPIFDARKIRVYDAWWNWVRVDLIELKQELLKGLLTSSDISDRIRMIINRWTSSCGNILKSLSSEHAVVNQLKNQTSSPSENSPVFLYTKPAEAPRTRIDEAGKTIYEEVPRGASGQSLTYAHLIKGGASGLPKPVIQLKQQDGNEWKSNSIWTDIYVENLLLGETTGLSFSETTALVTGAGPGSIASGIVQGLLEGGAQVFVTTSRPPPAATTKFFDEMYKTHGSRGSKLTVIPFNQASKQDCEALVNHIYDTKEEARDLDVIVPFAAIGETGQIDGIDAKSELAHRLMLTNLLRMLGHVKQQKEKRRYNTRPTSVILPLSPNHGTFGGDGLYSESKLGLETLFNRFHSEGWSDYLTVVGAVIGWTRGTGLMNTNNILAEAVEAEKSITFSSSEMAFSILALIHPELMAAAENEPILADISGNLSEIRDLKAIISRVRQQLSDRTKLRQALNEENRRMNALLTAPKEDTPKTILSPQTERANLKVGYPPLPKFNAATAGLANLQGLVDLSKTVVVVGFSELGPWGSSRTRWEMEYRGDFTTAGMVEIAWIMGLIEHVDGQVNGAPYSGWVDAKTKQPIQDGDIASTFGKYVLEHTGYRTIEPDVLDGYDPNKKEFLHEVVLDEDLPTFQASKATAEAFQLEHGDNVSISPVAETEDCLVKVKKGTRLLIPKAIAFNRTVAGLLPTGWNPAKYGIPDDIITQVDPITAYVLCCVAEALYSAGITDPFEIFAHMNTSELANCIGTGAGGLAALRKMYRERYMEHSVQSDIFQETFLNTPGAWVNLLLLSSTGPIKTNSGACATAIEAMDTGCESLLLGKSKMAFVGGADDFREEASYEFGNMKATVNTDEEALAGRTPKEMCRPSTTTRGGFMESAGCGIQIITTAEMALKMGLPIYGIVAHTQTSSDRIGRSIPAPGQGVLTAAREAPGAADSPLLDIGYRREKLNEAIKEIDTWWMHQLHLVKSLPADNIDTILESLERLRDSKVSNAKNLWGSNFRQQDSLISPMRAALAVWGLTVDDIDVASLHGTSTKANDKNEANVINQQMNKLGRSLNNPILTISQKWLTGHPKGAAGAWMFNGGIQVLQTGIVPGNRNADNIDSVLQPFEHLVYPPRTIYTSGIKAFMLTSFGFGQKGGLVIAVSPNHVFAAITEKEYEDYKARALSRQRSAGLDFIQAIQTNSLLKPKAESPWKKDNESAVLLDPRARAHWDAKLGEYVIEA